jgi:hypothetical protein
VLRQTLSGECIVPNQVLALHRVSPRCYDLTGLRTGNVRDQLLRSTLMVTALCGERAIGVGFPLLIFGAGAAGMNAAMLAAARHVDVTVVELTRNVFPSISASWLRRIDPTEYDWPHGHWKAAQFPMVGTIPLPQTAAMSGASLAAADTKQWDNFLKTRNGLNGYGTVTLLQGMDAHALVESDLPANSFLEVQGHWLPGAKAMHTMQFGARLSCIGHGKEQVSEVPMLCKWNGYAGPEFWTDSDGIDANRPLPSGVTKIVISGAGDGGMQDLQRAATSLFGRELYESLEWAENRNPWPVSNILLTDGMLRILMSAEETARRAFGWSPSHQGMPRTLQNWHDTFEHAIDTMVRAWPLNVATHVAQDLFRPELLDPASKLQITWLMRQSSPGYAYALNRYLSVLLCSLADRIVPGRIQVFPSSTLYSIAPVGHLCTSIATCLGKKHVVEIEHDNGMHSKRDADLIIVRHGVEPRRLLKNASAPVPEHMTPFDLPQ